MRFMPLHYVAGRPGSAVHACRAGSLLMPSWAALAHTTATVCCKAKHCCCTNTTPDVPFVTTSPHIPPAAPATHPGPSGAAKSAAGRVPPLNLQAQAQQPPDPWATGSAAAPQPQPQPQPTSSHRDVPHPIPHPHPHQQSGPGRRRSRASGHGSHRSAASGPTWRSPRRGSTSFADKDGAGGERPGGSRQRQRYGAWYVDVEEWSKTFGG